MIGDLECFYHSVYIPRSDRNYYRFFWYKNNDPTSIVIEYRVCVHLMGGNSSQSCCLLALNDSIDCAVVAGLLSEEEGKAIKRSFYSDDFGSSFDEVKQAIDVVKRTVKFLKKDNFTLTKLVSNSPEFCAEFSDEKTKLEIVDLTILDEKTVLGIKWNPRTDELFFSYELSSETINMKRLLLSAIAGIFDPTGLIAFAVLPAKLILQNAFRRKLGWDDTLPDDMLREIEKWTHTISRVKDLRLPRGFGMNVESPVVRRELHLLSDSSEAAYVSMCFLRNVHENGQISCCLVSTRNRLAPLKTKITIPRLELCGCLESARLATIVARELDVPIDRIIYWSDSVAALGFLRNKTTRFAIYVGNRVDEIQSTTKIEDWRYVPTSLNIADSLSR